MTEEGQTPEALREPTERFGGGKMVLLGVVYTAVFMGSIASLSILLPELITAVDDEGREISLGVVTGVAALFAVLSGPISGGLSDRTTLRFGRRRPWMLGGSLVSAAALAAISFTESLLLLLVLWSIFQLSLTTLRAFIPDQVPVAQRGTASGIFSLGLPFGTLIGLGLVSLVIQETSTAFRVLAAVNLLAVVVFLLVYRDPPLPASHRQPLEPGAFVRNLWVNPRQYPDFAYVWSTRLLVLLGWQMGTSYLLFFLEDAVNYGELFPDQDVSTGVFILTATAIVALIPASVVGDWLSDKLGRRRPLVIAAGLLMGVGLLGLAFVRSWPGLLVTAAVLGAAFGVFVAVELALITLVLPSSGDRGKDLGLVNITNTIPESLAPLLLGFLVFYTGYPLTYSVGAAITILGAILVTRVKGAR